MLSKPIRVIQLVILSLLVIFSSPSIAQAILNKIGSSFPMFNGANLSAWTQTGNAAWVINGQEIEVNQGGGMLISRLSVPDFQVEFDYWVSNNAQLSIYFRCMNPGFISAETAYKVPLTNQSKDFGVGSIVPLSKSKAIQVTNQWNHIQISAIGTQLSVTVNGVVNQVVDTRFSAGPIAIDYRGGDLRLKDMNFTIPGRW